MNKNKIWPVGLTVFLTFMVVSSLAFVYYTKQLSFDLVTEEYYQEGLAYQKQIDRINNTKKLDRSVIVQLMENNQVLFFFPSRFPVAEIEGSLYFFRPDNKSLDFSTAIQVDQNHRQVLDASSLKKGYWKVKVYWDHQSEGYYDETTIHIR